MNSLNFWYASVYFFNRRKAKASSNAGSAPHGCVKLPSHLSFEPSSSNLGWLIRGLHLIIYEKCQALLPALTLWPQLQSWSWVFQGCPPTWSLLLFFFFQSLKAEPLIRRPSETSVQRIPLLDPSSHTEFYGQGWLSPWSGGLLASFVIYSLIH